MSNFKPAYALSTWSVGPDTWEHEYGKLKKQFNLLVTEGSIVTLKNNEFINVPDTSQQSFEEYGMEDLSPLTTPTNKVVKTMDFDRVEGDGKIYRKTIDVNKYRKINGIKLI